MKKILVLILLMSGVIFPQYYGERTTDQSFESSSLFFNSHYLNTYGIYKFKDAAVGLVNDPFLNSYLNPAFFPDIGDKEFLIHIDFRGDKTKPEVVKNYVRPMDMYTSSSYSDVYVDPRWFSETRTEPEPAVSLGFIMYPGGLENKDLYIGGSYQLILSDESFYEMPYSIYSKNIYYDSFNARMLDSSLPFDYYSTTNEMLNEAHLLSLFSGYKISDFINAGVFINSVMHSRDGAIGNEGGIIYYPQSNNILSERSQNYDHFDFGIGVNIFPYKRFLAGAKIGLLTGTADQNFLSESNYYYKMNEPDQSDEWNYNYSRYSAEQSWKQDGTTFYAGVNLQKQFESGSTINWYYRFTSNDISTTTSSTIDDTSFYSYKSIVNTYNRQYYLNRRNSSLHDYRNGTGTRDNTRHEFMFNLNWKITETINIYSALYVKRDNYSITSNEPVSSNRYSYSYDEDSYENTTSIYTTQADEQKTLNWNYEAKTWTLQIPLLVQIDVNKYWGFTVGLNRILDAWNVDDITNAYVSYRYRNINGVPTEESGIKERYRQPDKRITDDSIDFITSFHANISDELHLRLLLNPEFEDDFRLDQWWLSFNAGF